MRTYARFFDASDFNVDEINLAALKNFVTHEHFVLKQDDGERHGKFVLNKTTYYSKHKKKNLKERCKRQNLPYRIGSTFEETFYKCNSKITLFEFEKGSENEVKMTYNDIGSLLFDSLKVTRDISVYTDRVGNIMKNNFLFKEEFIEIPFQEGLNVYVKIINVFDSNDKLFDTQIHASVSSTVAKLVDNFRPFEWMTEELEELPVIYSQY